MTANELRQIVSKSLNELYESDLERAQGRLERCLEGLSRTTAFQDVPKGARLPTIPYAFVEAEALIVQALGALETNDIPATLHHLQDALGKL